MLYLVKLVLAQHGIDLTDSRPNLIRFNLQQAGASFAGILFGVEIKQLVGNRQIFYLALRFF